MLYFLLLYANLGNPVYPERELATERLTKLVAQHPAIYGPFCLKLSATCSCPETAARLRIPLVRYGAWKSKNYTPKTVPVWPSCDCFVRKAGTQWVRHQFDLDDFRNKPVNDDVSCEENYPCWYSYRDATRHYVKSMIGMHRMTESEADTLLLEMWKMEKKVWSFKTLADWDKDGWQNDGFPKPGNVSYYGGVFFMPLPIPMPRGR